MSFYRVTFPEAKFFPKMHMLEEHIVPWLEQWRVGSGCMGEQGAEALHANFNTCERAYNNMRDRVERLKVVLRNHHMQIMPSNVALEPPPLKKRKKKDTNRLNRMTYSHYARVIITVIMYLVLYLLLLCPKKL